MQQQKRFNVEDAEAAQGTQKVIAHEARQNFPRVLRETSAPSALKNFLSQTPGKS
jgi:hypothetical protein